MRTTDDDEPATVRERWLNPDLPIGDEPDAVPPPSHRWIAVALTAVSLIAIAALYVTSIP